MKLIPLNKKSKKNAGKYFAMVDDEDYDIVSNFSWHFSFVKKNMPYAKCLIEGKSVYLHRLIMQVSDSKILIDHKDGNGLNCQKNNLRTCSYSENSMNRKPFYGVSSKYIGVSFNSTRKKWIAQITKDKKHKFIGEFENEKDAAIARDIVAKELHGSFAKLNLLA
jgi:hypothetical protein